MARFKQLRRRLMWFLPSMERRRQIRDRWLRSAGLTRTREPAVLVDHPEWRAENLLQYVVADLQLRQKELSVLQIGAFDGDECDDLRPILARENVRAILVEPQLAPFARLQQRYANNPRVTLVNAAIDKTSGTRSFYSVRGVDSLGASFDRNHLLKGGSAADIVEQQIACHTINDVLDQAGFAGVDLLQIDAEGYDYELIKTIDFRRCNPAILRFEFSHLSRGDLDECLAMLAARGYRFFTERFDILAVRNTNARAQAA